MRSDRILIAAVLSLILGLGWIAKHWHGTFGVNVAIPTTGSVVQLSGQASGITSIVAVVLILAGTVLLLVAAVGAVMNQFRRAPKS